MSTGSGLFAAPGHIYLVVAQNMMRKRHQVLVKCITSRGGCVRAQWDTAVTHVVTEVASRELLLGVLGLDELLKGVLVNTTAPEFAVPSEVTVSRKRRRSPSPESSQPHKAHIRAVDQSDVDDEETDQDAGNPEISALATELASSSTGTNAAAGWQCMRPASIGSGSLVINRNRHITDTFQQLYLQSTMDDRRHAQFRALAYRRAIRVLSNHSTRIESRVDAQHLPGLGASMLAKVDQILQTGTCQAAEGRLPWQDTVALFTSVHGVGVQVAKLWWKQGLRTLDDVKRGTSLTQAQAIGFKYYEEFKIRIPRQEVQQIAEGVERVALELFPGAQVYAMGSYRRGAATCGDVDVMITHPTRDDVQLKPVLEKLGESEFVIDHLCNPDTVLDKYMGVARLSKGHLPRRLDLLLVPFKELGAAMLYFTGNDIFNRSIRLLARQKGMSLNQHGLYRHVQRHRGNKLNDGEWIAGRTEMEIFEALRVPYLTPEQRNP
ncbi:hypothetical protein RI367_002105 [Sorochytrium milnesiophthora]